MANSKSIGIAYEDQRIVGGTIDNTVIGGNTAAAGNFTSLVVGGSTLSGTELGYLDGVTPGTVAANKTVIVDANKDASSFGNLTAAGTVVAATGNFTSSLVVGSSTLNATELGYVDGVTAGTAAANKALVLDAASNLSTVGNLTVSNYIVASGGKVTSDSGTATASSGAATLSKMAGVVTSEALTTAALGAYTLTLTNTVVAATDKVFVSVANGTNSAGTPIVGLVTPGSGSCTIEVRNVHATNAFNGTIKLSFLVVK